MVVHSASGWVHRSRRLILVGQHVSPSCFKSTLILIWRGKVRKWMLFADQISTWTHMHSRVDNQPHCQSIFKHCNLIALRIEWHQEKERYGDRARNYLYLLLGAVKISRILSQN
eukprot:TRINITY_DN26376_c0_g1_i1.p1 TRINITY_DN26376_c0_g1~~TRINITY_DN26376_c0_g1_i1.p1  ORF type:complete len:114 (+),score=8.98 TRINITY_DN26376_c0_g1_i1:108-449(+)